MAVMTPWRCWLIEKVILPAYVLHSVAQESRYFDFYASEVLSFTWWYVVVGKSSLCRSKGIVVGLLVGGQSWIIRPDYAIHCLCSSLTNYDDQDYYDDCNYDDDDDGDDDRQQRRVMKGGWVDEGEGGLWGKKRGNSHW